MHAVVMAAGEGTRMRPLTERWPKPVLPIDGRPVIGTLLRELSVAGCERVVVVTGHLAEQVEELVGDGRAFGLDIRTVRQPGVLGSADAVQRGISAGVEPPFLVVAADTVFTHGDIARVAHAFAASGAVGATCSLRDREARAPLWGLGPGLLPYLDGLEGPPFQLAYAFARASADGLAIVRYEIGKTRDLTYPVDLVRENFPYLRQ